jgi:rubredoxin
MERGRFVCGPLSAETQPQGEEGSSPAPVLEVMEGLEEEGEGVAAKPKEPRGFVELSEEELEKMSKEERFKYDKALEAARLRAAETFIIKETGDFECNACSFVYRKKDSDLGTSFDNLPGTWRCPICGAAKETFRAQTVTIAGFEVNQGYGFGTNTMTEGQKNLLIFGSLGIFFLLFIGGYALE